MTKLGERSTPSAVDMVMTTCEGVRCSVATGMQHERNTIGPAERSTVNTREALPPMIRFVLADRGVLLTMLS